MFKTSHRYAKSLIEFSVKRNLLEVIYKDIILVNSVFKNNKDLVFMLNNPLIYNSKKLRILEKVFYAKISNLTFSFFDLVIRKKRSYILSNILEVFINEYKKIKLIKDVNIITTFNLSDEFKNKFKKIVKNIIFCKEVNLIENIDKSLIGGYILNFDDKKLDESIKNKLNLLKLSFLSSTFKVE